MLRGRAVPDIFDEVDEDLRAERARRFFVRYGGAIVGAAVLVVVGVGGWKAWQGWQADNNLKVAQAYLDAVSGAQAKDATATALPALEAVAGRTSNGYHALALLQAAGVQARAGHTAEASALWDRVAQDAKAEPLLRDFANLQWALHNLDGGDPGAVAARLSPLATPDSPWRPLAQEAQAMLALRQGRPDEARLTLKQLSQEAAAPQGVRTRASGLLSQLGG